MKQDRDLANAILVEIRKEDGAQKYQLDREVNGSDIEWITGWPRTSNVKVGDTGKIVYSSTSSYGLCFFRKGESCR